MGPTRTMVVPLVLSLALALAPAAQAQIKFLLVTESAQQDLNAR